LLALMSLWRTHCCQSSCRYATAAATPARILYRTSHVSGGFKDLQEHYIGLSCNWPAPSFRVGVDCHEVPMVLVRAEDEEHSKPIWLVKALSSFNFVRTSPTFVKLKWNIVVQAPKTITVLCTYLGWDTKKSFKWTVNSSHILV
jgi:hypothetical protein